MLNNSWWPLYLSFSILLTVVYLLLFLKKGLDFAHYILLIPITFVFFLWFRDVSREGVLQGSHSRIVVARLKLGLVWFLFREVWFFFGIFWRFFHIRISPITGGNFWPLFGLEAIPPFQVPLLNTIVLLIRGVTVTLAHFNVLFGEKSVWLLYSLILGIYFLILQGMEYYSSSFCISSGVFGSLFFMGTGFHGVHVCLGSVMLFVSYFRMKIRQLSLRHHFFLEFSLWYWHFVDVVWLFLFSWMYVWGQI